MNLRLQQARHLRGEITVAGDKSITHRALLLSALADGPSRISGYLDSGDCRATMGCLRALGVRIEQPSPEELIVQGAGLHGWRAPDQPLDCVRSGTTMRLMAGLLAGQRFASTLAGDVQLCRRPMDRVVQPLRQMGARIQASQDDRLPPLHIDGFPLHGIDYALPVASAQVKSCVLLAGLYAQGSTRVREPAFSRDHTERMLRGRGVSLVSRGLEHTIHGPAAGLAALDTTIPADFSSAAFFLVGALLIPNSLVRLRKVNVNPTRTGLLDALLRMGADIELAEPRDEGGEPVADLIVRTSALRGATVEGDLVPRMIDEFPILALAATQAEGVTRVRGAAELRVKETDRIATITSALRALGARVEPCADGLDVEGPTPLHGAIVDSFGDHRLAMTLAIAGLLIGETTIERAECIADSFPGFEQRLLTLAPGSIL